MRTAKKVNVCLTFDFDAISVWIGNFHASSPSAISRGEFGVVGARRLLDMLREWKIPSTWFVPGHTADTYPDAVAQIAAAGHEIGHHGYRHERLGSPEEEIRDFDYGDRVAEEGHRPNAGRLSIAGRRAHAAHARTAGRATGCSTTAA